MLKFPFPLLEFPDEIVGSALNGTGVAIEAKYAELPAPLAAAVKTTLRSPKNVCNNATIPEKIHDIQNGVAAGPFQT